MKLDNRNAALKDVNRLREIKDLSSDDEIRVSEQPKLVSRFYDAVTLFYEFSWGSTFHFSPRRPGEDLKSSQKRQDLGIANLLKLRPGMEVADIGCGVGGPLVTIASATGSRIVGININDHQIRRGTERVVRARLSDSCSFLNADYMKIPLKDGSFDALYSIEAICHAPNRRLAFRELLRLLKPGGEAAIVDWTLTDEFDSSNSRHQHLKDQIERHNATPDLQTNGQYVKDMSDAGFDVLDSRDQNATEGDQSTPWYMALEGRDFSFASFARIPIGRAVVTTATRLLQMLKIVPAGTFETAQFLNVAADALVEAGKLRIFTPSFLVHARKPK